eukprot:51992-Pyramimonas_sp.AAC.2
MDSITDKVAGVADYLMMVGWSAAWPSAPAQCTAPCQRSLLSKAMARAATKTCAGFARSWCESHRAGGSNSLQPAQDTPLHPSVCVSSL